ncbi:hypothetical protein [Synechococcus sp. BMK-MC-1]|uniref:hypothetical protein n=1 Tax=Synechococcus sp. BMK-MC-1 TaxID=1442551 RepID=UPI001648B04F|nr:hypothetical protein [Synechococcus sp. BMK-MC-1]QNI66415.1 hypothetical protein SynBMKMC1_00303 [Synechococcus sp. BMK-MC-1]
MSAVFRSFDKKNKMSLKQRRSQFFHSIADRFQSYYRDSIRFHDFNELSSRNRLKNLLILPTEAFGTLLFDYCEPNFDILTYSYNDSTHEAAKSFAYKDSTIGHLAFKTEFYGESLKCIVADIHKRPYDQFLVLNGDVMVSWRDLNTCFSMAAMHSLDVFQPSMSRDSFYTYNHLLNKPGYFLEKVDFTEVMMLGLSKRLLKEFAALDVFSISGWGIDRLLLPKLIADHGFNPPSVIHACIAKHCKPVESGKIVFSNSKTAKEEYDDLDKLIKSNTIE